MISNFVLLYQYFDNEEIKLLNKITDLQERVIYRDGRNFSDSEVIELAFLKVKLDFLRKIGSDILKIIIK